jgi:hypothetical protein
MLWWNEKHHGKRIILSRIGHIAYETAICCNAPIHNFTGDRKIQQIINRSTLKHVMFLQIYKEEQFFCGYNILTEDVFVTNCVVMGNLSLTNCVGYDKLLFHE